MLLPRLLSPSFTLSAASQLQRSSFTVLSAMLAIFTLSACSHSDERSNSQREAKIQVNIERAADISSKLYHSGGIPFATELCPQSPYDTITPVANLAQISSQQSSPLDMTISGIAQFIESQNITTMEALLNHFPDHFRTNFSLVEHTKATGESNLDYPRIVLFGSDGRLLMNIGTKPDDPTYQKLDIAELDTQTGLWEFSVFDFGQETPQLTRNDPSCNECHGNTHNARPVWGDFQQWTGVFGDSVIDGPRPEALDHTHAGKMNELMRGNQNSERFGFLKWRQSQLRRGGVRFIANHDFGPELLLSNVAMGSATALGAFVRLQQQPNYTGLRKDILLAYLQKRALKVRRLAKVDNSIAAFEYAKLKQQQLSQYFAQNNVTASNVLSPDEHLDALLQQLALDPNEAFSLDTLHETEQPNKEWRLAAADLYDLLMLQILDDLRRDDTEIAQLLEQTSPEQHIFQCPDTANNISDLVDFKMLHLFQLSGEARYQVNWIYYPKDVEDIYDQVFLPVSMPLIQHLTNG